MYAGEVNVSEEQIPTLLNLAETLGIKGLADFNNGVSDKMSNKEYRHNYCNSYYLVFPTFDLQSAAKQTACSSPKRDKDITMCDTEPTSPTNQKISPSPLESLFNKPQFPFFPLLPAVAQPLNFSQHSARLATDLFNKFNSQLLRSPESDSNLAALDEELRNNKDTNNNSNNCNNNLGNSNTNNGRSHKIRSELKKIDKIAENLRTTNKFFMDHQHQLQLQKSISSLLPQQLAAASPMILKPPCSARSLHNFLQPGLTSKELEMNIKSEMNCTSDNNITATEPSTATGLLSKGESMCNAGVGGGGGGATIAGSCSSSSNNSGGVSNNHNEATNLTMDKSTAVYGNQLPHPVSTPTPPGSSGVSGGSAGSATNSKAGNSKLFATCFICHKQLSNQYNLRVHLETHQNVR